MKKMLCTCFACAFLLASCAKEGDVAGANPSDQGESVSTAKLELVANLSPEFITSDESDLRGLEHEENTDDPTRTRVSVKLDKYEAGAELSVWTFIYEEGANKCLYAGEVGWVLSEDKTHLSLKKDLPLDGGDSSVDPSKKYHVTAIIADNASVDNVNGRPHLRVPKDNNRTLYSWQDFLDGKMNIPYALNMPLKVRVNKDRKTAQFYTNIDGKEQHQGRFRPTGHIFRITIKNETTDHLWVTGIQDHGWIPKAALYDVTHPDARERLLAKQEPETRSTTRDYEMGDLGFGRNYINFASFNADPVNGAIKLPRRCGNKIASSPEFVLWLPGIPGDSRTKDTPGYLSVYIDPNKGKNPSNPRDSYAHDGIYTSLLFNYAPRCYKQGTFRRGALVLKQERISNLHKTFSVLFSQTPIERRCGKIFLHDQYIGLRGLTPYVELNERNIAKYRLPRKFCTYRNWQRKDVRPIAGCWRMPYTYELATLLPTIRSAGSSLSSPDKHEEVRIGNSLYRFPRTVFSKTTRLFDGRYRMYAIRFWGHGFLVNQNNLYEGIEDSQKAYTSQAPRHWRVTAKNAYRHLYRYVYNPDTYELEVSIAYIGDYGGASFTTKTMLDDYVDKNAIDDQVPWLVWEDPHRKLTKVRKFPAYGERGGVGEQAPMEGGSIPFVADAMETEALDGSWIRCPELQRGVEVFELNIFKITGKIHEVKSPFGLTYRPWRIVKDFEYPLYLFNKEALPFQTSSN